MPYWWVCERVAFLDGEDVAAGLVVDLDHLLQAAGLALHHHVGQQHRERLVADEFAGTPDGMAEAERNLLAGEAGRARLRQVLGEEIERLLLAAAGQCGLKLVLDVEMILDHRLVAAGDEDQMLDAGLARLVDRILDQRAVDDRQHFLRHGFGRGQEAGAKACDGKTALRIGAVMKTSLDNVARIYNRES